MGGQSELSGKVLGAGDPAGREFRSLFDDALSRTGGTDHRLSWSVLPRYHTIGRQTTKCDRLSHPEPPPAASALPRLPQPRRSGGGVVSGIGKVREPMAPDARS